MVTRPTVRPEPSVFGFRIRSDVPLRFLRSGGGVQALEIVASGESSEMSGELLGEWPLQGTVLPAHAKLWRVPTGYEYWTSDAGRFRIDLAEGRIVVPANGDPLLREQRLHGMPMILSFLSRGDVSLHAAAIEIEAGAVIIAAPSRHGKSTLAFAFQRHGYRVLSEDLICCRPSTAEAIPGPALLRIRRDVFHQEMPEGLYVVAERPDRIFVGFSDERGGTGAPVPIKAIVFLREAAELAIEKVPQTIALKDLWRLSFRTGTNADRADSFQRLVALAGSVAAYNVYRPLLLTALDSTVDLIASVVVG